MLIGYHETFHTLFGHERSISQDSFGRKPYDFLASVLDKIVGQVAAKLQETQIAL